jgi:hypothetical protein
VGNAELILERGDPAGGFGRADRSGVRMAEEHSGKSTNEITE